jgi:hypothetical protein
MTVSYTPGSVALPSFNVGSSITGDSLRGSSITVIFDGSSVVLSIYVPLFTDSD